MKRPLAAAALLLAAATAFVQASPVGLWKTVDDETYKVRLTPKDGGKAPEVRGCIGPFYRNQTWLRVA